MIKLVAPPTNQQAASTIANLARGDDFVAFQFMDMIMKLADKSQTSKQPKKE